ncbi:hypothetical protein Tco_0794295 [Tanacetum coccineum]
MKETEDRIKEGTLKVDHGANAMTVVLGKEKGGYARGVPPVDINPKIAALKGGAEQLFVGLEKIHEHSEV